MDVTVNKPKGQGAANMDSNVSAIKRFDLMRALVIDEDKITAGYTVRAFGRLGISCEVAENIELALQMLNEARHSDTGYDICLLNCCQNQDEVCDVVCQIRWCDASKETDIACLFRKGSDWEDELQGMGVAFYVERPLLQSKLYQMMIEVSRKNG